mmetsp:Transcript_102063/g.292102  ORF Transcript_102063/g.292102 Transcript_102063/m.292102 type:complete len:447 (+) Transcript_102063:412-1752(+)
METVAYLLDGVCSGAIIMSNIFLSSAVLDLAAKAAGCDTDDLQNCKGRVYGMRPEDIYSATASVAGLVMAIMLPLIGAIIDHTDKRMQIGQVTAFSMGVVTLAQACVSHDTWFLVTCLQVVSICAYTFHNLAQLAYLPELTANLEQKEGVEAADKERNVINSQGTFWMFATEVVTIIVVYGVGTVVGAGNVDTAAIGQAMIGVFILFVYWLIWSAKSDALGWRHRFLARGKLKDVPEGQSLVTTGFRQIASTLCGLKAKYPYVFLLLIGVMGLVTAVAPFLLHGATDKAQQLARELMPIFAVMWGVGFGVYYPCIQATYTMIIPAGSEAELMGLYYFCTKVLSWAPPLLFVVFNNWTGEQKAGLWVLAAFFLLGIIPYCMLDLEKARGMVAHTLQSRAKSPRSSAGLAEEGSVDKTTNSQETAQVENRLTSNSLNSATSLALQEGL